MRFPADRRQHFFPADRRKSHFFGSTAASTLLCANPYCIPALRACIPTMFKHFLACISIISKLFSLCASLVYSGTASRGKEPNRSTLCAHLNCIAIAFLLPPALFFVRTPTVFQHGLRALLLCSSTQCCTQCSQCCALLRRNVCTQCWNAVGIRTNTLHFYFALALFVCLLRNYTFYWICCISASKPAIQHSWGSMKETR